MLLTLPIAGDKLLHTKPEQFGAIVAYAMKSPYFCSVMVSVRAIEITFNIADITALGEVVSKNPSLEQEMLALLELDPYPCGCGCGQFIALGPCFNQAEVITNQGLTPDEHLACQTKQKIRAIKLVRERLKIGIKDAKDLVDKEYPL